MRELLQQVNSLHWTLLRVGQELRVPGTANPDVVGALSPEVRRGMERARQSSEREVYRVRPGDNLWLIARRHRVGLNNLMSWNGLSKRSVLRPGQKVVIWRSASPTAVHASERGGSGVHVVRSGDSLWLIARRHKVSTRDLARWNGISPSSTLRPGQRLRLAPPRSARRATHATGV